MLRIATMVATAWEVALRNGRRNAAEMAASGALIVRKATPADAAALSAFGARTFGDAFGADNTPSDMEAYLAESFSPSIQLAEISNPASAMTLAVVSGGFTETLAGYMYLVEDPDPASVFLKRIYVDKAWQGSGLGSLLIEEARRECRRRGRQRLWLTVWERNPRAVAFYEREGLRISGTTTFTLGDDVQTDFVMETAISAP
jgi:GNAT superfamily N-acetyltransferase